MRSYLIVRKPYLICYVFVLVLKNVIMFLIRLCSVYIKLLVELLVLNLIHLIKINIYVKIVIEIPVEFAWMKWHFVFEQIVVICKHGLCLYENIFFSKRHDSLWRCLHLFFELYFLFCLIIALSFDRDLINRALKYLFIIKLLDYVIHVV